MPIAKLSSLLISQIAAGEVIERPASVVKELLENSIDAGATRIEIAVEQGGAQLIRVSDDGRGIPEAELPLALAQHATSKLQTPEQLAAIHTLGFRGEALASIASVSRLRLTSRPRDCEAAATVQASGDQLTGPVPAASSPGTVIEVRDLFFNVPARRKFLRATSTEFGHIHETVARLAMVHPAVGLRLAHHGRKVLDLPSGQSPARRCIEIIGAEMAEQLLEFQRDGEQAVWGLAGLPALARASGKFLYLCVNGRCVRDRNLVHAVREAYRGLIPPDRHPTAVVFLTLDPRQVDVNVHPAKAEVRFREPSRIHGLVLTAVRQTLLGADLTPSASVAQRPASLQPAGATAPQAPASPSALVDYFRQMDPTQKGFVYQEVKRAVAEDDMFADADDAPASDSPAAEPASAGGNGAPQRSSLRPQSILQVHNSYLVTQDEEGLLIVDQHALHERVMFETLRRRVLGEGKALESQRLLMPEILDADEPRQALLADLQPLLSRIGIEAEPIGPRAVAIQAFPSFLFSRKVEAGPFLTELLEAAEEGEIRVGDPTAEEAALHEVLDMMACKAAVKAGDRLTEAELAELLARRREIERSSNCPHGRPTTLRLSLKELEKQFGRA
jgi:DNA mismatch repair protein MutL